MHIAPLYWLQPKVRGPLFGRAPYGPDERGDAGEQGSQRDENICVYDDHERLLYAAIVHIMFCVGQAKDRGAWQSVAR